jgi:hypothetical protein
VSGRTPHAVRQVWLEATRRQDASHRVRSFCDREAVTTRGAPARNFQLSGFHACVCPDPKDRSVHDPSALDGQARTGHTASDQGGITRANASSDRRRNGPMAVERCARLAQLPCRAQQLPLPLPFRGRGDSSLAACTSQTEPTWSQSLDVGTHATPRTASSPPPTYSPPVSQ